MKPQVYLAITQLPSLHKQKSIVFLLTNIQYAKMANRSLNYKLLMLLLLITL